MAFVKLDCGILNSTLWMDRAAREVFITALLMAEPFEVKEPTPVIEIGSFNLVGWDVPPGWYGFVPAASIGIIGRAKLDPDEGMAAIRRLSDPDPDSRSPEFEGRRMVRINGGFLVLNFMKYRDFDHGAAERMRRFRERKKVTRNGHGVTPNDGERNANNGALPPNVTYGRSRRQKQKAEEEGRKESEGASRSVRGNGSEPELSLHGSLPRDSWDQWLAYRREQRLPLSHRALALHLKRLSPYDTETQQEMLETAIQAGWSGVFPPKGKQARRIPAKGPATSLEGIRWE